MSDFQFPQRKSSNMVEFMNKINDSFEWQNFQAVDNNNDVRQDKSETSNIFDKSMSNSKGGDRSFQFNNSKDILQISYISPGNQSQAPESSFRFETSIQHQERMNSSRYDRIQKLLTKAKQNSLDFFFKNLQEQNKPGVQPPMFSNKQDFKSYVNDLKHGKKQDEESFTRKRHKQQPAPQPKQVRKSSQPDNFNFVKKPSNQNYFLPDDYVQDDGKDFEEFDADNFKLEPKQYDSVKEAIQFFSDDAPRRSKRDKKEKKKSQNLDTIRQEKATLFQKTLEQQRLNMLLGNYKEMRENFEDLMTELKQTNQGQTKIVDELTKIKQKQQNVDKRQLLQLKKKEKQRALQAKKQQFQQIKQEINRIREDNKDLLFLKINEKIETLQKAVKDALEQIAEEKEQPFTPKIINYFCEGQDHQASRELSEGAFSEESAVERIKKDSRHQMPILGSKATRAMDINRQNFISPFDIAMEDSAMNEMNEDLETLFQVADFAKPYYPKILDSSNKHLRKSLTQKSSVAFESFQFHVSSKFTLIDNEITPLMAEVRVSNKCMIDLADVFVIVYGSQGSDIMVRPTKIARNVLQPGVSFDFEVFLNKQCIEDSGFYVQISYRTNIVSKKKVNAKISIPIIQLIKPEFIYQQQFVEAWNLLRNEMYIAPKTLDFLHIRSHQDLKLILPFTHITEENPNVFSYGIMFSYPKSETLFLMKLICFINGKASVHLRSDTNTDHKVKEEIMDAMNYLIFSS